MSARACANASYNCERVSAWTNVGEERAGGEGDSKTMDVQNPATAMCRQRACNPAALHPPFSRRTERVVQACPTRFRFRASAKPGDLQYGTWASRTRPSRPRECGSRRARLRERTGWDEDERRRAEMAPGAPKEDACPTRSRSVNARARPERPRRAGREAPPPPPSLARRACPRATGQREHGAARIVRGGRRRASSGRTRSASPPLSALSAANV
jgi:hypothetical protein